METSALLDACMNINMHGFNPEYVDLFVSLNMKMPYLDINEEWPEEYEYLHATEDETYFIRHVLLHYISDTHVIPMLQDEVYRNWYIHLTKGKKSMILRLPTYLRDLLLPYTDISKQDILLFEREIERLQHPFPIPYRDIQYTFDTSLIREGNYLLYRGDTLEGAPDEYKHLCSLPSDPECQDDVEYDNNFLAVDVYLYESSKDLNSHLSILFCGCHYSCVYVGQYVQGRIIDVTSQYWNSS